MRFKIVEQQPRTYVVVFSTGDELASGLKQFARDEKLGGSSFQAIGAFSSVKLGWFDWETKQYRPSVTLGEQVELVSLIGDVALADGQPQVHAHVVVAKQDGTAHGGHLMEAHVLHRMTDLSLRQYAAGNVGPANVLLKQIQQVSHKIHLSVARNDKRLKRAEISLSNAAFHLTELLRSSDYQDRPLIKQTIADVNKAQDAAMMQVFDQ